MTGTRASACGRMKTPLHAHQEACAAAAADVRLLGLVDDVFAAVIEDAFLAAW